MALEQLFLIAIFILVPLLNFVLQRLRRRLENQPPPHSEEAQRGPAEPQETAARQPRIVIVPDVPFETAPNPLRRGARAAEQNPIPSAPARPALSARSLLRSPQDVRRGIVLMTVLGPCRAYDPSEGKPF